MDELGVLEGHPMSHPFHRSRARSLTILLSTASRHDDADAGGVTGGLRTCLDQGLVHGFAQGALHTLPVPDAAPHHLVWDAGSRLRHLGEAGKFGGTVGGGLAEQPADQQVGQLFLRLVEESLETNFFIAAAAGGTFGSQCSGGSTYTNAGCDDTHREEQRKDRDGDVHLDVACGCCVEIQWILVFERRVSGRGSH